MNGGPVRIVLLCAAASTATRTVSFAPDTSDEPALPGELARATALVGALPRIDEARRAPSGRCRQTAEAIGRADATTDRELAGCDFGDWTGRTLDEVLSTDPDGVTAWLTDPHARPHGGESGAELVIRVGGWLDARHQAGRTVGVRTLLAVADQTAIRAAVAYAVQAGPQSIWRFDIAPLSRTELVGDPGRWSLRSLVR
jgi:broad specificity phosphatase PhoE